MAQVINTNVASLNAQRNLSQSGSSLATSLQRLSSGLRINSAKDDAAGLAISERFTAQINGLNQAVRNANDGISLAQTAEGALGSAGDFLQRIRVLAVQSANASNSAQDRQALQNEVTLLTQELDRVATTTNFNGKNLFNGTFGTAQFQVGANAFQTITANTANLRTTNYGNHQNAAAGEGLEAIEEAAVIADGAAAATGVNGVEEGTLTINGYIGGAEVKVEDNDSAKTIAANINAVTGQTGVTAHAQTNARVTFDDAGSYSLQVMGDNTEATVVSFDLSENTGSDALSAAVTAFNDQAGKTGITASLNAENELILTSATGSDIILANAADEGNADTFKVQAVASDLTTGIGDAAEVENTTAGNGTVVAGQITLDSDRSFSVAQEEANVFADDTTSSTLNSVSGLDITSFQNATDALKTVDAALNLINSQRSSFGALQSRFEATVSNLQATSENLSASRSRILDTDFAAETANLTRAQILQQAGTAMLAQANALPQNVLSLLS